MSCAGRSEADTSAKTRSRNLESDFIVTGSYLGRILDKGFKYSAGDLDSLEIHMLDFEEFLTALDKHDINESKRYFDDILDDAVYDNMFFGVARILAKEKMGFDKDSFSEELQGIVVKDYSSNISKAKARCYFSDIGLTSYFLTKIGCPKETAAFATLGAGEIDFYVKAIQSQRTYALEVNLDYALAESTPKPITTYEYSFRNNLDYGGSEGIYLDLWIETDTDGGAKRDKLGTFKTLETSGDAMHIMANLLADFIVEGSAYVNAHLDDFCWEVRIYCIAAFSYA